MNKYILRKAVIAGCILLSFIYSNLSYSRWTSDQLVPNTKWIYNERSDAGRLVQCQIATQSESVNGSSLSIITVAVLSKGTIIVSIEDAELANRINIDFGWEEGKVFSNVRVIANDKNISASGKLMPGLLFSFKPYDGNRSLTDFFEAESFLVMIDDKTAKAFNTPMLSLAWKKLRTCSLL